ncbi:MAG TPA: hypothetical protein VGN16_01845 [Acidobacteriaceae bacterium]
MNLHLGIPVLQKAGRGIPFSYNLSYDSSIWYPAPVGSGLGWLPRTGWGWNGDTDAATGYVNYSVGTFTIAGTGGGGPGTPGHGHLPPPGCNETQYTNFVYYDSFGTAHQFSGSTSTVSGSDETCPSGNDSFTSAATDGSGYTMSVIALHHATITTPTGEIIQPPGVVLEEAAGRTATGIRSR